ncbi:MAG: rRNA maturation RNase YbeY [Methylococcales bacterium]|nr:rRNA maturation RNase YbeY [Methylococcales bacterium]
MSQIELQIMAETPELPERALMQRWVDGALGERAANSSLTLRFVDELESAELNLRYRHKEGSTNILSFPFEAPPELADGYLGDLVICVPLVLAQARQQGKTFEQHCAHLIVHGVLHLLGYDHQTPEQAEVMEALEIALLHQWQIPNPYHERLSHDES